MPQTWIMVAAALVVICTAVGLVATRRRSALGDAHHFWTVSRANTSDGATAHLEVEVVVELTDSRLQRGEMDHDIVDVVEEEIRRRITDHPVASLPSVGDDAPFLSPEVLDGARIVRAVVSTSVVEVTPELRRLMTDRSTP